LIWLLLLAVTPQKGMVELIPLNQAWFYDLGEHEIYRSRALAVSDSDRVAVIDRDEGRVVLLSADGAESSVFGRKGQGPGELEAPVEITWDFEGERFAVLDGGASRISYWDRDGNYLDEDRLSVNGLVPRIRGKKLYMVRDAFGFNVEPAIIRLKPGKEKVEELFVYDLDRETRFSQAGNDGDAVRVAFRWDPKLCYDLGSNFVVWTFGDSAQVHILDLKGRPRGEPIAVKLPRPPITDKQIEEGIGLMPREMHASLHRNLVRPEGWPLIRDVFVDEADRIWVIGSSRDVKSSHPFRLLSREGDLLGRGYIYSVPNFVGHGALYYLEEKREVLHAVKVVPDFD